MNNNLKKSYLHQQMLTHTVWKTVSLWNGWWWGCKRVILSHNCKNFMEMISNMSPVFQKQPCIKHIRDRLHMAYTAFTWLQLVWGNLTGEQNIQLLHSSIFPRSDSLELNFIEFSWNLRKNYFGDHAITENWFNTAGYGFSSPSHPGAALIAMFESNTS